MSDSGSRANVHPVFLPVPLYLGVIKLSGALEIGKSAAILTAINDGLKTLGFIEEADYIILKARYARKLRDIVNGEPTPSHVQVVKVERKRANIDFSGLSLEELQTQYDSARERGDTVRAVHLKFEAKRRNVKLESHQK